MKGEVVDDGLPLLRLAGWDGIPNLSLVSPSERIAG